MSSPGAGPLLREWRGRRRRSQMDLAHEAGVSPRHLSFVETGRAKPSRELLLTLARHLEVPLRERNSLLLAAGYAPRYQETPIESPVSLHVRASLERLLATHDPYPGVVLDRRWNVVFSNAAAGRLMSGIPAELLQPRVNVFRVSLHPNGLAAATTNFDEWASYMLGQLRRQVAITADEQLVALEQEILRYPNIVELTDRTLVGGALTMAADEPPLLVPCNLTIGGVHLSLFTMISTFGTPRDITLDELAVELFFPADDATADILRAAASA